MVRYKHNYCGTERERLPQLGENEALDASGPDFPDNPDQMMLGPASLKSSVIDIKLDDCTRRLLDA